MEEAAPGPGGWQITYDYRSVRAEILVGIQGSHDISKVFLGFEPQSVGLIAKSDLARA